MQTNRNYQLGLLYLVHLLINADGVIDEKENSALKKVKTKRRFLMHSLKSLKRKLPIAKSGKYIS